MKDLIIIALIILLFRKKIAKLIRPQKYFKKAAPENSSQFFESNDRIKSNDNIESNDRLFDGDDKLFKELILKANIYGEYGCGKSTSYVFRNTNCKVISVDTDENWVNNVKLKAKNNKSDIKFIDLGPVGNWGRPINYDKQKFFKNYTNYLWEQNAKPDLVLIDGRFRICCFLTSLKYGRAGTKIIFDDYVNRPHYHVVEKYAKRERVNGRQCLFIIPEKAKINGSDLDRDIDLFRNVMD